MNRDKQTDGASNYKMSPMYLSGLGHKKVVVLPICITCTYMHYKCSSQSGFIKSPKKYNVEYTICQIRGFCIQKGLVETSELSVFALFAVTRLNKEQVEAQPWTSTHPPSVTAHMHTQVEGGH